MPIGATIGGIATAAGVGLQAYGMHKAGKAQEAAGEAGARASESQAQLADFNADVSELQGKDALDRGNEQANEFQSQVRGFIGTQRTAQAASGVDVGFGSTVDVQADTAYLGKLDEMAVRANAVRAAWGYQVQTLNYREQARILRETGAAQIAAGESAATASNIAAIGTVATGAGSMLSTRYGFGKKGS